MWLFRQGDVSGEMAKQNGAENKTGGNKVLLINLKEQGPIKIVCTAFAVLKPAITIERHDKALDISLRFNLQTSFRGFDEALAHPADSFHSSITVLICHI